MRACRNATQMLLQKLRESRNNTCYCLPQGSIKQPILRANPSPKVTDQNCRLPLPTFFFQLEAMNLGDLMRFKVRRTTCHTQLNSTTFCDEHCRSAPEQFRVVCRCLNPFVVQNISRVNNRFTTKASLFGGNAR